MSTPLSPPPLLIAPQSDFNTGLMAVLTLLGAAYCAWMRFEGSLTGNHFWDATCGVLLGIYICSRPATNLMDMLYTQKILPRDLHKRAGKLWLLMNFITTFSGWASIVMGAMQMVKPD
jgi:hypothetical protein